MSAGVRSGREGIGKVVDRRDRPCLSPRNAMTIAIPSLKPLALPAAVLAAGLAALALVPGLVGGSAQQDESLLVHHLRTCPDCSADDGKPILRSYLDCPVVL